MAEFFAPLLDTGELTAVLGSYCSPLPGYFLFYPSRRHLPMKLRAFVDHVRVWRSRRA